MSAAQTAALIGVSANFDAPNDAARFEGWRTVGPNGGDVRSLVVDPTNDKHFYFSTLDGQIYTSNDAGASWRLLTNFNRPQLILDSMLIDSRDSKTIYAAGHRGILPGGFFKSTDGGETWREVKELKSQAIYALAQSKSNPDMLVIGTYEGAFASFNSGNEWKKITDEKAMPELVNVESIAIDPRSQDVIYAGTWHRPYKTTDGGKTWKLIATGMIDDSDVFAINIDPRNPDHVIASACSGIYDSTNKGENWAKINGIPSSSRRTRDILQHPTKAGYVYAGTTEGFWMSAAGGASGSWSLTTSRQVEINSIAVPENEPNKVYIGTNNYGVMVSNDYGKTFAQTNAGYSTRLTYAIVPDAEQPNRFYAATHNTATGGGFFFISSDGGASWQASMSGFNPQLIVYSILQSATQPNTIYVGTNLGVYRSLNRGATWTATSAPKTRAKTTARRRSVAGAKTKPTGKPTMNPNTVVATTPADTLKPVDKTFPAVHINSLTDKVNELIATRDGKNGIIAATDKGLYRTYDIAKGWDKLQFPFGYDSQVLTVAATSPELQTIYAGTAKSGLLISHDNGRNWTRAEDVPQIYPISHITVDSSNPERAYIGTKQTFFMTKDNGAKWDRRGGGLPAGDYNSIIINPSNPNEIFAASSQENRDGLYRSSDGGINWARVDTSKLNLASRRIWALAFDPRNPDLILAGSHSAGIYRIERAQTVAGSE